MSVQSVVVAFFLLSSASPDKRNAESFFNSSVNFDISNDSDYSCSTCDSRTFKKSHRLESIKTDILRKLRMASPPNVTGIRVPNLPHLQMIIDKVQMETQQAGYSSDNELSTTMTIFRVSQSGPSSNPDPSIVYFDLYSKELLYPNKVVSASFCIYIRKLSYVDPSWYTYILLYRAKDRHLLVRKKITYEQTGQWISFNITSAVQQWLLQNASNHGLDILCRDNSGESLALTHPKNEEEMNNRSYLHMDIMEVSSRRKKRDVNPNMNCEENSVEQMCCRYPLEVNFEEFGWDWIIIPKTYPAYYCSGDCPVWVVRQSHQSHASQQSEKYKGMCCAPKSTSSISMLYYDERKNIVYGRIPGMTVNNCDCI